MTDRGGGVRGCLLVIVAATLVVVGLATAWLFRDPLGRLASRVIPGYEVEEGVDSIATGGPQLAGEVDERMVALGRGELEEVTLSERELNAWITYGLKGYFPGYLDRVTANLRSDDVVLAGRVSVRDVPGIERLGTMAAFLGDTADVAVTGTVDGLAPGRGVFYVEDVRVGAMTLPDPMRDQLLAAIRGRSGNGGGSNAVVFEVPEFVGDVAVHDERLVLRRVEVSRR
jgi:hypothetical protein